MEKLKLELTISKEKNGYRFIMSDLGYKTTGFRETIEEIAEKVKYEIISDAEILWKQK